MTKRQPPAPRPALESKSKRAYLIAWIGELGGIAYIQVVSEQPEALARAGQWPMPVLVFTGDGKSFEAATKRCMEKLKIFAPAWVRFIRDPVRSRAGSLGAAAASVTRKVQPWRVP